MLSRKSGTGQLVGDLKTGEGIAAALDGCDAVLHLATNARKDSPQTARLLRASRAAGVAHFVYVSIVGIDDNPYSYYRDKLECERLVEESGVPYTILRATQFHDFVARFIRMQRRLPVIFSLDIPDQPIAVEEVASRLVELADGEPVGRAHDIGGPEAKRLPEFIDDWQRAFGTRKRVWNLPIGGKIVAAFRTGEHMTPLPGYGHETFAEYAARQAKG